MSVLFCFDIATVYILWDATKSFISKTCRIVWFWIS